MLTVEVVDASRGGPRRNTQSPPSHEDDEPGGQRHDQRYRDEDDPAGSPTLFCVARHDLVLLNITTPSDPKTIVGDQAATIG